jgi:hypothetical protein
MMTENLSASVMLKDHFQNHQMMAKTAWVQRHDLGATFQEYYTGKLQNDGGRHTCFCGICVLLQYPG